MVEVWSLKTLRALLLAQWPKGCWTHGISSLNWLLCFLCELLLPLELILLMIITQQQVLLQLQNTVTTVIRMTQQVLRQPNCLNDIGIIIAGRTRMIFVEAHSNQHWRF